MKHIVARMADRERVWTILVCSGCFERSRFTGAGESRLLKALDTNADFGCPQCSRVSKLSNISEFEDTPEMIKTEGRAIAEIEVTWDSTTKQAVVSFGGEIVSLGIYPNREAAVRAGDQLWLSRGWSKPLK